MQEYPFYYELSDKTTPFSIIRGGISSFNVDACALVRSRNFTSPPDKQSTSNITWVLKSYPSGDIFSVRQVFSQQSSALTSEKPLHKDQTYETLEITVTASQAEKLRSPEQVVAQLGLSAGIGQNSHIMTFKGEVRVENLRVGDKIVTRDHGLQPLLWVGTVSPHKKSKPVFFAKNSINNSRDMMVCSNQLVVLKGPQALLRYGQREVLIAARTFVNGTDIHFAHEQQQSFFQLLLNNHEVIYAEATAMESFLPSVQNLSLMSPGQKQGIFKALPSLQSDPASYGPIARSHVGETIH